MLTGKSLPVQQGPVASHFRGFRVRYHPYLRCSQRNHAVRLDQAAFQVSASGGPLSLTRYSRPLGRLFLLRDFAFRGGGGQMAKQRPIISKSSHHVLKAILYVSPSMRR